MGHYTRSHDAQSTIEQQSSRADQVDGIGLVGAEKIIAEEALLQCGDLFLGRACFALASDLGFSFSDDRFRGSRRGADRGWGLLFRFSMQAGSNFSKMISE